MKKHLISMVAFVLEQSEMRITNVNDHGSTFVSRGIDFDFCFNYANFLSKKLEIWQFVPCKLIDGVWVVLEEPKSNGNVERFKNDSFDYNAYWNKQNKEYQEAKERCCFEGFTLVGETDISWIFKKNDVFPLMFPKNRNIDFLAQRFEYLELTPTGQKESGLI